MSTSPATKKQKTANGSASTAAPCEVVRGDLMQPASRKALREAFKTAEPYTHAVLKDVFDSDLLKQVRCWRFALLPCLRCSRRGLDGGGSYAIA